MKDRFYCPHCHATLNPNVKIILSAAQGGHHGLILLDPKPGIYESIAADELQLAAGDRVDFQCPICRHGLTSRVDENLAELGLKDREGREGRVDFSRVYGEHATYIVVSGEVRSYGEHAGQYQPGNFFGESAE